MAWSDSIQQLELEAARVFGPSAANDIAFWCVNAAVDDRDQTANALRAMISFGRGSIIGFICAIDQDAWSRIRW